MSRKAASIFAVLVFAAATGVMPGRAATSFTATFIPGSGGYEPGITMSSAGTLFVNEPTGTHSLYRLADAPDAKWTKATFPSPQNRFYGGFDSDAAVGHGTVYEFDLSIASNTLYRSDDDGQTWAWSTPITTIPPDDRAWIATGPKTASGETVYASWTDFATNYVMFARSEDSAMTFTTQTPILGLQGAHGDTGKMVADPDSGFIALPYFDGFGGLSVKLSNDRGDNWHDVQITDGNVFGAMQNIAKVGNTLHTVWIDGGDFSVKYSRSTDLGETWSPPVTIAPAGSNVYPWVAASGDKVSIAWYASQATTATDPNNLPATNKWFVDYTSSSDAGLTFTAPIRAYANSSLNGPVCTNGIGCDTGGKSAARQLGDFMAVVIDSHGKAQIAAAVHGGSGKQGLVVLSEN